MSDDRHGHSRIVSVTCIGVAAAALYALFSPTAGHRSLAAYRFPDAVPLAGWELIATEPLRDRRQDVARALNVVQSGQRYRYANGRESLDAEIRYVAGTRGEIGKLLGEQTAIPPEAFARGESTREDGSGFHTLFAHDRRACLSACISQRGGTTVTVGQFVSSHRAHDFHFRRVMLWLVGKESLRDYRCLWVLLSTPAQEPELPDAFRRLGAAWADWHRAWPPRFPHF